MPPCRNVCFGEWNQPSHSHLVKMFLLVAIPGAAAEALPEAEWQQVDRTRLSKRAKKEKSAFQLTEDDARLKRVAMRLGEDGQGTVRERDWTTQAPGYSQATSSRAYVLGAVVGVLSPAALCQLQVLFNLLTLSCRNQSPDDPALMFLQELGTLRFLRHFVQLDPTLHMLMAPICRRFVSASGALLLADVELPEPIARWPSPHVPARVENIEIIETLCATWPNFAHVDGPDLSSFCVSFRCSSTCWRRAAGTNRQTTQPSCSFKSWEIEILETLGATWPNCAHVDGPNLWSF